MRKIITTPEIPGYLAGRYKNIGMQAVYHNLAVVSDRLWCYHPGYGTQTDLDKLMSESKALIHEALEILESKPNTGSPYPRHWIHEEDEKWLEGKMNSDEK